MALTFLFKADGSQYTRGLEKMRGQTKAWSGGISKMIVGAFAAGAALSAIKKLITASSDLSETLSKSRVVFKDNAKAVEDWADTLDSKLGQSKASALDAAAGFASMFDVLGVGATEAMGMSKRLVELASDMASFHNTSVEQALEAIGSGLRGEAEPLRKYNVLLNDATLKAEAMTQGMFDGKGALDLRTKAQAAYNVILTQSSVVNGDFENTSDGLANSTRIMKAEIANLAAEFGNNLIPAIREAVKIYELAKIVFGGGVGDKAEEKLKKDTVRDLSAGIEEFELSGEARFTDKEKEELTFPGDDGVTLAFKARILGRYKLTLLDFYKAIAKAKRKDAVENKKRAEEEQKQRNEAAKILATEKANLARVKETAKAQEKLNKLQQGQLSPASQINLLYKEQAKLLNGISLADTPGSKEELENIKKFTRADEIGLEIDSLNKGIKSEGDAKLKKEETEGNEKKKAEDDLVAATMEMRMKQQAIIQAGEAATPERGVIASSLASIGGGGNVASFTSDPILAATIESNKILLQIEKNTERTLAYPTTPEL